MKTIEYANHGEAIADHKAEDEVKKFLLDERTYICVSTENFVTATRTLIAEGRISHEGVRFLFMGVELKPTKHGRLWDWPKGFCDHNENWLMRLLDTEVDKNR